MFHSMHACTCVFTCPLVGIVLSLSARSLYNKFSAIFFSTSRVGVVGNWVSISSTVGVVCTKLIEQLLPRCRLAVVCQLHEVQCTLRFAGTSRVTDEGG